VGDLHHPPAFLNRALAGAMDAAIATFPVVALVGARQTGKSTLCQRLRPDDERLYLTLDDLDVRADSAATPDELVQRAPRITLDEVQREPDLLLAVKRSVDGAWQPGQFLLTGSANLLLMQRVSESLAGRACYLTLWPLTRRELLGLGATGIWDEMLREPAERWLELVRAQTAPQQDWRELARRGGYPVPAHRLADAAERARWLDGYVRTYLERDLQQLSQIEHIADFRRLMRAACLRLGGLLNQAELARDVGIAPSTAQRYMSLLETSFQLLRLEAYSVNRTKRLVKSPKLYWCDTALAMQLGGESQPRGAHLENIVLNDLLAWRETTTDRPEILYWRTSKGAEVDFVVEHGTRLLPIEVRSAARVRSADVTHLKVFLDEYRDLAEAGLVLHAGEESYWVADRVLATPWWRVV
jgi:predicted AAA+ superfamily ATPase